jgi:phage terminase large subunit GpA-like protein
MKWETIKRRAEPYKLRTIPPGCLLLTCAVDTQNDRLEVEISGWGRGLRNWTVDHVVFRGDPALPDVWNQLDRYLDTPIVNQFGVSMRIELCAVDSGGSRTQDVYDYCRLRRHRGVFAIKGAKEKHKPIIGRPTDQDVTVKGKTYPNGVKLWPVGTDTAKSRIFGALLGDEEREVVDRRMHFSVDLDDEYFEQLTAEAYNPSKDRWDKLRKRNEALDLKVYNFACAYHPRLRLNAYQDADWAALEAVIEPRVQDLFASVPAHDVPAPASEPAGAAEKADADTAVLEIDPNAELAVATVDTASEPAAPATDAVATQNSWIPRRDNWLRR